MRSDQHLLTLDRQDSRSEQTPGYDHLPGHDHLPGYKKVKARNQGRQGPRRKVQLRPPADHPARIPFAMSAHDLRILALSRKLYIVRIVQAVLAVTYVALTLYSYVHPGWWLHITTPTIIASRLPCVFWPLTYVTGYFYEKGLNPPAAACVGLLSFLSATYAGLHLKRFPAVPGILHLLLEAGLLGLWITAFVFMTLGKGKDYRTSFATPPYVEWGFAMACSLAESVAYGLSTTLVWKGGR